MGIMSYYIQEQLFSFNYDKKNTEGNMRHHIMLPLGRTLDVAGRYP